MQKHGFVKLMAALLLFTSLTSCGKTDNKELIVGKWTFVKYDWSNLPIDVPEKEVKMANELNRELLLSFSPDNNFESSQKGGMEENNQTGKYTVLPGNKLAFPDDTIQIVQLDKTFLKLYRNESTPVIIFKRQ